VTGGAGFLGGAIARWLHERGWDVTIMARSARPAGASFARRYVQGDVRNRNAVERACEGLDAVFHVAAKTGIWGPRREFFSVNVEGTRNVIAACRAGSVPKLIHTSSPSVVFGEGDLCGVDESQPYPTRFLAAYPESKCLAERMVIAANGPELCTIALRPHLIWGVGDPHLVPRIVARARAGKLRRVGDGTNMVDLTHVENAAHAHVLAAEALSPGSPCAGSAYFISDGSPVNLWGWIGDLLEGVGVPFQPRSISFESAYRIGRAMEALYRVFGTGREPPMTRFLAHSLARSHYFNISAARRDLGYIPCTDPSSALSTYLDSIRTTARSA